MANDLHEHLIDLAYEAAVVPELWPNVLHQVGGIARARGIVLLTAAPHDVRWVASPDMHDDTVAYVEAAGQDEGHDYGYSKRAAVYGFFTRYLKLDDTSVKKNDGYKEDFVNVVSKESLMVFEKNPLPAKSLKGDEAVMKYLHPLKR